MFICGTVVAEVCDLALFLLIYPAPVFGSGNRVRHHLAPLMRSRHLHRPPGFKPTQAARLRPRYIRPGELPRRPLPSMKCAEFPNSIAGLRRGQNEILVFIACGTPSSLSFDRVVDLVPDGFFSEIRRMGLACVRI